MLRGSRCIRPVAVEIDDEFDANEQKLYKIIFTEQWRVK